MLEKLDFIRDCLDGRRPFNQICERYGISEKCGRKWRRRFVESGPAGLEVRSHARHTQGSRISSEVAERIIALRKKHPLYGPVTLRDVLMQREPEKHWPAASSIGELLRASNLIRSKRRVHCAEQKRALEGRTPASAPNTVWTADFKGEFRLAQGRGRYCYPLTVLDLNTHFLLGCKALESTAVGSAQKVFVRLFQEYGLPSVLRSDNGVPFAQPNGIGRLGALGFWWVKLGIRPEHIKRATPSENGAHERFHRTLKASATKPSSDSYASQQKRFDLFRAEYNHERPHHALKEHRPPATYYTVSPRSYPSRLPKLIYPDYAEVRLVDRGGSIKWRNTAIFLSTNIAREYVSITEAECGTFVIAYGPLQLGLFDCDLKRFTPRVMWSDNSQVTL